MSRPDLTADIAAGYEAWEAWWNDFKDGLVDAPFPIKEYANLAALAAVDPSTMDRCLAVTADTGELWISDGSSWRSFGPADPSAAHGAYGRLVTAVTELTLTGGMTWAAFPQGCIKLGVSGRVTEAVTSGDGGTDLDIGDGTDADLYKATLAFTLGSTFRSGVDRTATISKDSLTGGAENVVITMNGGTPSAGKVRLVASYFEQIAPTA